MTPSIAERIATFEHDSPLGQWRISLCRPRAEIAPHVETFWAVSGWSAHTRECVLPRCEVEVFFNLSAPHHVLDERWGAVEFRRTWIAGLQQSPLTVQSPTHTALMAIRLRPMGAFAFLDLPMMEVTDAVVELDQLMGNGPVRVHERLLEAQTLETRFAILEDFVIERVRRASEPSPHVCASLDAMKRMSGAIRVADLARDLGISDTRLVELFKREVGLTPKRFARIVRLQGVLAALGSHEAIPWAALAQDFGFFDQAHFAKDFRDLTGASPTEFLRRRSPDGQALVVDAV